MIAALDLGSSSFAAIADDELKDADNLAWLRAFPADVRHEWERRLRWVRLADRMAEAQLIDPTDQRFTSFHTAWHYLLQYDVPRRGPWQDEIAAIDALWSASADCNAWADYLSALADYHVPGLVLRTIEEHDRMLWRLSGRIMQLVPYLEPEHREAIAEIGRLDQFLNNIRDLAEDSAAGICYLPADVLSRFGVTRELVISGEAVGDPGWVPMMRFWMNERLAALHERAMPFQLAKGLHPSLRAMRFSFVGRYDRVERVFCDVDYDYRRFPAQYWAETKRELGRQ